MKVPISKRLLCCASLVPKGARVADVGTDHGYLGIHLLLTKAAEYVVASDIRPLPLENARTNAARFAVADRMTFCLSDGLAQIGQDSVDTIVCAGMGGDLIVEILKAAPWLKNPGYTLILEPQSAPNALRAWLSENGFAWERETLVEDGGFVYAVMKLRYSGISKKLSPGEQYISEALLRDNSPLLPQYLTRLANALAVSIEGLRKADKQRPQRLAYFEQAYSELRELKEKYANGQ